MGGAHSLASGSVLRVQGLEVCKRLGQGQQVRIPRAEVTQTALSACPEKHYLWLGA